jgi:hypothetical protein
MTQFAVLYLNGLGHGETGGSERLALRFLQKRGIAATHGSVDWYARVEFSRLLERIASQTQALLEEHGRLTLVGSSASGSLAISVLGELADPRLSVVTLCSRAHPASQRRQSWNRLQRIAHGNARKPNRLARESVRHCWEIALPRIPPVARRRIVTVQPWFDNMVPVSDMTVGGAVTYRVPVVVHDLGIAAGVFVLPIILSTLLKASST